MNIEQLFSQALGIVDPWYIKSVNFNSEKKKLDIEVDFKKSSTFRGNNNGRSELKEYKAYDTIKKTWRHLNFFEHECHLHCRTPRIKMDGGNISLISPPWSGVINGFTFRTYAKPIFCCQIFRYLIFWFVMYQSYTRSPKN